MNKILPVLLAIFIQPSAFSQQKCDDMSHVRTFEGIAGEIVYKQDDCRGWSSVQRVDGKLMSEPQYVKFLESPSILKVDDEHEAYEARHNWGWNESADKYGQVLAHSYFYQGLNKKTGTKTLIIMVETFTRLGEFVHRGGAEVRTDTAEDGTETKFSKPFDDFFKAKIFQQPLMH